MSLTQEDIIKIFNQICLEKKQSVYLTSVYGCGTSSSSSITIGESFSSINMGLPGPQLSLVDTKFIEFTAPSAIS